MSRVALSVRVPALRPLAVAVHRCRRRWQWLRGDEEWASGRTTTPLPNVVADHRSVLLRELAPEVMHLQRSKVTNLRLASPHFDGLVIRPGETFSFNRTLGNCTRHKGYVDGLRLTNGDPGSGVGGGICQIANLIHWMVLHSPLTVVERSEHSFDPFPDARRVVPWGVGCSIVYNYVDLVVRNDTDRTFELRVRVGDTDLHGELRADSPLPVTYVVQAREERFERNAGRVWRSNEIWRRVLDADTGEQIGEELLRTNRALVTYEPSSDRVVDV